MSKVMIDGPMSIFLESCVQIILVPSNVLYAERCLSKNCKSL